jgi:hypothetical protein
MVAAVSNADLVRPTKCRNAVGWRRQLDDEAVRDVRRNDEEPRVDVEHKAKYPGHRRV